MTPRQVETLIVKLIVVLVVLAGVAFVIVKGSTDMNRQASQGVQQITCAGAPAGTPGC